MVRMWRAVAAAMLAATGGRADVVCDTTPAWRAAAIANMFSTLEDAGYTAGDVGRLDFTRGNAFGNNPSSLYGVVQFTELELPVWWLDSSDAIVWLGCSPPLLAYMSARSYVFTTHAANGSAFTVFASLGDSNNILTMNSTGGVGNPCNKTMAVITTADVYTAQNISAALVAAGVPATAINWDIIPAALVHLCRSFQCDTLSFLLRVALFDDPVAGQAYTNQTQPVVTVLAPQRPQLGFDIPALRPRDHNPVEAFLAPQLDQLATAAQTFWTSLGAVVSSQRGVPLDIIGYDCLETLADCAGDNRDAAYIVANTSIVVPDERTLLVIVGVNHGVVTGSVYSNFDVNDGVLGTGVVAVDNRHYNGSARVYNTSLPNASLLYTYTVARNCSTVPPPANEFCLQVTLDMVPADHPILLAERSYLQIATRTAVFTDTLVMPYILEVQLPPARPVSATALQEAFREQGQPA